MAIKIIAEKLSSSVLPLTISSFAAIFASIVIIYLAATTIYNLYFHPLAKFPGAFLGRVSLIWRLKHGVQGSMHYAVADLHKKYGKVVRVSPNELSFSSVESWRDIYGFPPSTKDTMIKSSFYDMYGSGFDARCIGSERNPREHRRIKATLSVAFSAKSLSDQEYLLAQLVDKFVERVGELGSGETGINMTKWLEMIGFDLMGELTFGESFHCVETGTYHFWTRVLLDHLNFITLADSLHRISLVEYLFKVSAPLLAWARKEHTSYTAEKVAKRLESKSTRQDFLTNLVGKVESGEMSRQELFANASTLVIAGSETTATAITAILYYILKPSGQEIYQKLRQEIRTRFQTYEEIDFKSAQQLPYLQSVMKEGLRIFPTGQGLPRISPGRFVGDVWVPKGAEVYTSPWAINHSEEYWLRPDSFEPNRWLYTEFSDDASEAKNSEFANDVREASQPFSVGPNTCLGTNFARMEMTHVLTKLMWKYDMELVDKDLDYVGECKIHLLWWKPDVMVRFTEVSRT